MNIVSKREQVRSYIVKDVRDDVVWTVENVWYQSRKAWREKDPLAKQNEMEWTHLLRDEN